jgi:hypothetical protein
LSPRVSFSSHLSFTLSIRAFSWRHGAFLAPDTSESILPVSMRIAKEETAMRWTRVAVLSLSVSFAIAFAAVVSGPHLANAQDNTAPQQEQDAVAGQSIDITSIGDTGTASAIANDAIAMINRGRQVFRFDTFGDEAFWGGQMRLHQTIEGARFGGIGPGLSPRMALTLGLKVDSRALPPDVVAALKAGKVNLDDPAVTLALLKLRAVVGVTGFFMSNGSLRSVGIQCALCHSTVDDSLAPGIGRRLDGWANRDLNVGAIIAFSPTVKPFVDLLGVNAATVRAVLNSIQPHADQSRRRHRQERLGRDAHPTGVRPGGRQPPHLDRMGFGHTLECICRQPRDAWQGEVLRSAAR